MREEHTHSFWARIYISGPDDVIEQVCRKECKRKGLCVTVTPTKFIYTGGEETGVEVGLINYAKFPEEDAVIRARARDLALKLKEATYQDSVLVVTPMTTTWFSDREG